MTGDKFRAEPFHQSRSAAISSSTRSGGGGLCPPTQTWIWRNSPDCPWSITPCAAIACNRSTSRRVTVRFFAWVSMNRSPAK